MTTHEGKGPEIRMSNCEYGCKIYRCKCGTEHVWHSAVYGCPTGRAIERAWAARTNR